MKKTDQKILFHVFSRDASGTSSAKKLRKQGKVVGNIYGLNKPSISVFMDSHAIKKLYNEQGDTGLIYLQVDDSKKQTPVLITEYETDAFGAKVLHVAFKRVDLTDPVQVDIPVSLVGEANIPDAVVSLVKDVVTVEALPGDLPEGFEIDISGLSEVGQSITLAEVPFDKSKMKLILAEDEDPQEVTMVVVQEVKEEPEQAPEEAEETQPETEVAAETENKEETTQEDNPEN